MAAAIRQDNAPIPVTLVTERGLTALDPGTAYLRLAANTGHGHADGDHCIACASRGDVRAVLFDLLEEARQGIRPEFSKVVLDVADVVDKEQVVAALTGRLPAQAYRDHTVARRFYLV